LGFFLKDGSPFPRANKQAVASNFILIQFSRELVDSNKQCLWGTTYQVSENLHCLQKRGKVCWTDIQGTSMGTAHFLQDWISQQPLGECLV